MLTAALLLAIILSHPTNLQVKKHEAPRIVPAPLEFKRWEILYLSGKEVWTCDGDGKKPSLVIENAGTASWSPDKKQITFSRGSELWVANRDGSRARRVGAVPGRADSEIGWLTWGTDPMEERTDPEDRDPELVLEGTAIVGTVEGSGESNLYQYVLSGPKLGLEPLRWLQRGTGYAFSHYEFPSFSPDSRRLAFIVNGDIWVAERAPDLDGWDVTRVFAAATFDAPSYRASRENHVAHVVSWSPDSRLLAYGVVRKGGSGTAAVGVLDMQRWDFWSPESEVSSTWLPVHGHSPSFSPDGNWILFQQLGGREGYDGLAAISVDGKRIVQLGVKGRSPRW